MKACAWHSGVAMRLKGHKLNTNERADPKHARAEEVEVSVWQTFGGSCGRNKSLQTSIPRLLRCFVADTLGNVGDVVEDCRRDRPARADL